MKKLLVFFLAISVIFINFNCYALNCPVSSFDTVSGTACGQSPAVLSGTYTVATLPSAAANQAHYSFVTDLGGGADMVISDGTYWKHIRRGLVTNVAAATTLTQTPLTSPTIIYMTGGGLLTTTSLNLVSSNLYPGYEFTVVVPAGVLSALGVLGVQLGGTTISGLPVLNNGQWADYQYNGTTIVKLRGGNL